MPQLWTSREAQRRRHISMMAGAATLGVFVGSFGLRRLAFPWVEKALLTTKPNGGETPADAGLDFDPIDIPSGDRVLRAWYVRARPWDDSDGDGSRQGVAPAVFILHGRHESISQWVPVQAFLAFQGISSMVFDYSGFGDSTGAPSVANLREDVRVAYEEFLSRASGACGRYVLGYSLGTGLALEAAPSFGDSVDGVILVATYSSARDAMVELGIPFLLALVLPDLYDNVRRARDLDKSLLIIHSRGDTVFPVRMAEKVYAAAREPKQLVVIEGPSHNALVRGRAADYLAPAVEFISRDLQRCAGTSAESS